MGRSIPTRGSYLLDTNVAIAILNQQLSLSTWPTDAQVYLGLTVVGELEFGASKSRWNDKNRRRIEALLRLCPLVPQSLSLAREYGTVKAALQREGRPIPENDLWIAACALEHGLTLVTRDRHFQLIERLDVEIR